MEAKLNGATVFVGDRDGFENIKELLAQEAAVTVNDFEITMSSAELNSLRRERIELAAGDTLSILGTTADAAQIVLYELSKFCTSLNKAQSLAEVRTAAQSLTDLLGGFAVKVDAGEIKLPYQAKGISAALEDIEARATAVTQVLESNA